MIAILDYGMGNLRSVQKGFEKVGHRAVITSEPEAVQAAAKVVLPGVGAFQDAMAELLRRGLAGPIREAVAAGKPFLGICLGLQLLFETSYEDGRHTGLGILEGEVLRFSPGCEYKVPHMGWNQLAIRRAAPILAGLADGTHMYFVHSYFVVPRDEGVVAAATQYPEPFASAVWRDNVFGVQFHPEKSQASGLRLLQNFAEL